MKEKDASLRAVVDSANRNLLDPANVDFFAIDLSKSPEVQFQFQIENGPEAPIDLEISCDQPWLLPETKVLRLVGGESGRCTFKAVPQGDSEYANILFSWKGQQNKRQQAVAIRRVLPAQVPMVRFLLPVIAAAVVGGALCLVGFAMGQASTFGFFGFTSLMLGMGMSATQWILATKK